MKVRSRSTDYGVKALLMDCATRQSENPTAVVSVLEFPGLLRGAIGCGPGPALH